MDEVLVFYLTIERLRPSPLEIDGRRCYTYTYNHFSKERLMVQHIAYRDRFGLLNDRLVHLL